MSYFIIILTLFCSYKIYSSRGQNRFDWFICSMMVFASSIIVISKPQMPCHRLFLICYWLSVFRNKENKGVRFPLKWALVIYVVTLLVISLNAANMNVFYKFYKPFVYLLDTYFILLLTRYGVREENFLSKKIVYTLLFVTLYGVFTLITRTNPIQSMIASAFGHTLLDNYYWGNRIRITSTWSHPIAYGLICAALFFEYLPYWKKNIVKVLMVLLAVNVFVCGSRTALAAFLLMGGLVVLSRYSIGRAIKQAILLTVVLIPIYLAVPFVQEKVDSVVNTALGNDDVGGSSLEMRDEQSYYAMLIVSEKPMLGHGFDYIMEGLGYGTDNYKGDWHLLGFESYSYVLLIERGFVGFFLELFIWLAVLAYALKKRKIDKEDASLVIAYILGFAFFSMSTGTLDTKIPMMFLTGVALSKLSNKEQTSLSKRNNLLIHER